MLFVNKIVGTMSLFTTATIEDYLRGVILSKLNFILGTNFKSVLDITSEIERLNSTLKTELTKDFNEIGLDIYNFYIQSISVPDEVQKIIDTKSGMSVLGNLDQYMKFKLANAIGDAANNSNATSNVFNTGAGLALGMMMPQMLNSNILNSKNVPIDSMEKLKKLKELLEIGAITQEEFDEKKKILIKEF